MPTSVSGRSGENARETAASITSYVYVNTIQIKLYVYFKNMFSILIKDNIINYNVTLQGEGFIHSI